MKNIDFMKALQNLNQLCEFANEVTNNHYEIIDCAFGFMPIKNNENRVNETTYSYINVARWLLDEMEKNRV